MAHDELLDFAFDEIPLATTSDDYYTPKWVFDALGLQFDIDVASPVGGISWIPANQYFTLYDDGLAQDWNGRVWMNPPYSKPLPWIQKFIENENGVALLPTSTGKWMKYLWESKAKWLLLPPMKFIQGNMVEAKGFIPVRCWLIAVGDENVAALKASGIGFVR